MIISDIIKGIKNALTNSGLFKIVETYEGQFEDIDNFLISPPHAFIEMDVANNDTENYLNLSLSINIYLCTSHMKTSQNLSGMYDLMENTINLLHSENVKTDKNTYDKLFFHSFQRLGILPGLAIYKLNFKYGGIR